MPQANAPHEAGLLRLDISRARERLAWRSSLDVDTALAWIVEWHQSVADGADARHITEQQIARYRPLASRTEATNAVMSRS